MGEAIMTFVHPIVVRKAIPSDVRRLVDLNGAAYPDLIQQGVVYSEEQLAVQLELFPAGQLVAEIDGAIVGAISSLIPPTTINPLAQHTWMGITDGGMFSRHDPAGRTLYLADIYVDPGSWGRGVSKVLYAALLGVCRELRLDHVVAGGRLWGYCEVADRMTAREYVDAVVRGTMRDRVLNSQLRAGFLVRGLLRDYLHDWRSCNWATLLEMPNPDQWTAKASTKSTPPSAPAPGVRTQID
jgi:GNAT superfamily N-acetyltransferase